MADTLHAPWRMDYIRSLENADQSQGGCFLCQAVAGLGDAEQRKQRFVIAETPRTIVVMNKFPYTNGHLLVAPRTHVGSLEDLPADELLDLQQQTVLAVKLLKRVMAPQGFNIGINQGRCAGAGLPGHLHQHVVPRWGGDVNFMSVVGDVRIQPQALEKLYEELVGARPG
jgi:ATP adenylyltransferase